MNVKIIEATQDIERGMNHGKFLLAQLDIEEFTTPSLVNGGLLLPQIGYWEFDPHWLWVLDLQTREGAYFHVGHGSARADLQKHRVWVCPLFEPFLEWLYTQRVADLADLPAVVELPDAPGAFAGYRRPGPDESFEEGAGVNGGPGEERFPCP